MKLSIRNISRTLLTLALLLMGIAGAEAQNDRQFIRSGNKLYRAGNYVKAEAEYLKAVQKNPNNPQAVYNLGCALMMQQKDSAAIVQFQKAGQMEKAQMRKSKAYHNIGVICQSHRMYAQAIEAYKESLRNNPADNQTRYNLALCKRLQKNQKQNQNKQKKQQNKDDKNKDKNKNKDQQQKKQQKQEQKMSKDNAEQLLNAAMQQEQATQERMKKAMRQQSNRQLQKNW